MRCDSQCSFFDKGLYASNDSLRIEVAIEPFIEASFEVEEEKLQFASFQPLESFKNGGSSQLELIFWYILFQTTT